ncbi:MAG: TonB-dependent receptor, partial [Porticoccaceae bacterium]|nr:TonB-dependent receptor [Porticoccaceae bacterium]
ADVSFEYYYGEGNAISLGLFYKDIESFFAPVSAIDNTPGQFNGFTVTRPENIGSGSIRGLELAYLHNFDHLPGLLKHTGVQANYTYSDTSSGAVDQQTGRDISLPGQSDNTANASLFFDNGKVSSRLAWAWRDEFFTGVSNGNAVIVGQTRQLDWNINYNITDQLAVFVEGINLTDENTADVFAGTEERILGQGRFGRRFFFGVNYKL